MSETEQIYISWELHRAMGKGLVGTRDLPENVLVDRVASMLWLLGDENIIELHREVAAFLEKKQPRRRSVNRWQNAQDLASQWLYEMGFTTPEGGDFPEKVRRVSITIPAKGWGVS